jgi:hypothetical protein
MGCVALSTVAAFGDGRGDFFDSLRACSNREYRLISNGQPRCTAKRGRPLKVGDFVKIAIE